MIGLADRRTRRAPSIEEVIMAAQPLFPVTVVGSWTRPAWLVRALRQRQAGEISAADFDAIADDAVLVAIKYQEDAGCDILSDGEQRRDNFYSFVVDKVAGMRLMKVSELLDYAKDRARFEEVLRAADVPAFAIKSPIVVEQVRRRAGLAVDEIRFLKAHTQRQVVVPLPGPYMLTRSSWFAGLSDTAYPTAEDLARDIVALLREEIADLQALGVDCIQLDEPILTQVVYGEEATDTFMCAALSARRDPSTELDFAVRLMNETVAGFDGVKFGVHICRGNWSRKEAVLLEGNYGPLVPWLLQMDVDRLVLEYATPRAGELAVFGEYPSDKEIGLGVVNPRTEAVESPAAIVARVREALEYFPPEKIYLNPDCGFGTFAERCVNDAPTAYQKLAAVARAAEQLRQEYA
jgi:5-methyltetrahydropteroyltriglutamate--homocysteine methyltransferase